MRNSLWIDRNEYPFASNVFPVRGGKMHYIDVGRGPVLLMVHGTPTWSFLFRRLITGLSPHFRCIAPDHLGFGLSDKPKSWSYKPEAHAENLEGLIDHLKLKRFSLLVHDYGGPIGLSYALRNRSSIEKLILLNTWMWSLKDDSTTQKASRVLNSAAGRFLYEHGNYSARVLMRQAMVDKSKLSPKIHAHYTRALPDVIARQGTVAFGRALIGSSDWFDGLWRQREAIRDIPTLILWGMQDKFIRLDALDRWLGVFSDFHLVRYQNAGHFLPEECPHLLTEQIDAFLHDHQVEFDPSTAEDEPLPVGRRAVILE
jgi:pimeloyl-ACP methyl ester carboxylesterase